MIAYSRGSNSLAGAASLKNRMPAIVGAFIHPDIAHWTEQQTDNLRAAGSIPAIHTLCKQLNLSDPGMAPATLAR
jgi:hypothetical protein